MSNQTEGFIKGIILGGLIGAAEALLQALNFGISFAITTLLFALLYKFMPRGGVLFRSAESSLLPSARVKLDQVTRALLAIRARNLIVEGYTDSQGSESYNQGLSQRRADAVRDYLVLRDYPASRIQSHGNGEGSPIADNVSPEGRANNRRVEIVIQRELRSSNP